MLQKRMTRRSFLQAAALASGGVFLAACGAKPTAQAEPTAVTGDVVEAPTEAPTPFTPSSDSATVDIWLQQGSIDLMKGATAAYAGINPEIKVNFVPMTMTDASNNLLAAIAAGAGAPDAAFIDWYSIMKFTLRDGIGLNDLTPQMGSHKEDWVKWNLDLVTTKSGKLIGLPEDLGVEMMFYRRDVFDEAGLPSDPESVGKAIATWDEMIATGKKVTEPGKRYMLTHANDVWGILNQAGEVRYYDDNGQPIVNSEKFIHAAEVAVQARKANIEAKWETWSEDWMVALPKKPGQIALYPCAAWWDQISQPLAPETKGLWGVVPLPSQATGNTGGSFFVFPEMSKKWENAYKVTSYIEASDEGLTEYMKSGKFLPGYSKFYTNAVFSTPDPFYADQVWLQAFVEQVDSAVPLHLDLNDPIATEVLGQTITNILDNDADPKTELDAANEEIKKRIAGS